MYAQALEENFRIYRLKGEKIPTDFCRQLFCRAKNVLSAKFSKFLLCQKSRITFVCFLTGRQNKEVSSERKQQRILFASPPPAEVVISVENDKNGSAVIAAVTAAGFFLSFFSVQSRDDLEASAFFAAFDRPASALGSDFKVQKCDTYALQTYVHSVYIGTCASTVLSVCIDWSITCMRLDIHNTQ
jgi:hypothetical protein